MLPEVEAWATACWLRPGCALKLGGEVKGLRPTDGKIVAALSLKSEK
jgi:hypothetical protein